MPARIRILIGQPRTGKTRRLIEDSQTNARPTLWLVPNRRAVRAIEDSPAVGDAATFDEFSDRVLEWNGANVPVDERLSAAARLISKPGLGGHHLIERVIVDGFGPLSIAEFDAIVSLAEAPTVAELWLSLPLETESHRPAVFHSVAEQLAAISARMEQAGLAVDIERISPREDDWLAGDLFRSSQAIDRRPTRSSLRLFAAEGESSEWREIACEIKDHFQNGFSASEIAVVFPEMPSIANDLASYLCSCGIRAESEHSEPLIQQPIVRAILQVLSLVLDDWPTERLLALLGSSFVRPTCSEWDKEGTRRAVRVVAARAKLIGERDAWLQTASADSAAGVFLHWLDNALDGLTGERSGDDWGDAIQKTAGELGIAPISDGPDFLREREKNAWENFLSAVRSLGGDEETVSLADYANKLRDVLSESQPREISSDAVALLAPSETVGVSYRTVLFGGLTEDRFPKHAGDRLRFLRAVCSVVDGGRLVLSYTKLGSGGVRAYPSPVFTAVRDLMDDANVSTAGSLRPIPAGRHILNETDRRVSAAVSLRQRDAKPMAQLSADPARSSAIRNFLAAARVAAHRFSTRGFTRFEGELSGAAAKEICGDRFPAQFEFSVSQLEQYAKCPFQYFANRLLRVAVAETTSLQTPYLRRGDLIHDALAQLLDKDIDALLGCETTDERRELIHDRFNRYFEQLERRESKDQKSAVGRTLHNIDRQTLFEWAEAFAAQWEDYPARINGSWATPPVPTAIEAGFGDVPADLEEAPSSTGPLVFGESERSTRVRGRIDRIDIGTSDGKPGYVVIDYKSGAARGIGRGEMESGRSMQLPLYAIAARRLGLVPQRCEPTDMAIWNLRHGCESAVKRKRNFSELIDEVEENFEQLIPQLAADIRSGRFFVHNTNPECTRHCDYSTTCRVNQIRPLANSLDKTPHARENATTMPGD